MKLRSFRPGRGRGARGAGLRALVLLLVAVALPAASGEGWTGHDCPHHAGVPSGSSDAGGVGDPGHGSGEAHGAGGHGHASPARGVHEEGTHHASGPSPERDHHHDHGPCTCVGLCSVGSAVFSPSTGEALRTGPAALPVARLVEPTRTRTPDAPLLYALPRANAPPRAL